MAVNWRKIFTSPYSDKTHFIYELIQNADDSKSKHLELQLRENELLVWNDGRQFTKKDVDSICSIGFSNKDLTQIGTFGMGITAVFTYTDCLEVYSGDRCFRIKIKDPTKRENIDFDEIDSTITEQLNKDRTVFRLPFRKKLRQEDIEKLRDRLCNVGEKRPLLFLRHLERIVWRNELGAQIGSYFCDRCPPDKIPDASEVELTTFSDDNNQRTETFLVFNKKAQPPQNVIDEILYQAEGDTEQQRIQQSVKKPQPIEVAFRLQDSRITTMADKCMLFSYLSTQKETHLRFIIQARYQTTLARENIEDIEDNLWNRWLVRETANFLPEILEQLKSGELLEPAFFDVLPLKKELEKAFKPIATALRRTMREEEFVPTQDGKYAKAENVFYPHRESLRELIESSWLYKDSSWLHSDIRDTEAFRRCFKGMREAGVREIGISQVLDWLGNKGCKWFEDQCEEWLRSLYLYLNSQKSELERIKKLPLVRLENEEHVCASEAFFPPKIDEEHEDIAPFLNELPILQSALLEGEDHSDIKDFLEDIGVEALHPEKLINQSICPLYGQPNKPAIMKNRWHVRYIFKSWQKAAESERSRLEESLSKVPILRAYKGMQQEISDFVVPCNAYLPQAYIGDNDLETYFSVYDGDLWFVDDKYLTNKSDTKAWLQFLKAIGAMATPRILEREVDGSYEECKKRSISRQNTTWTGEEIIEDRELIGLSMVLYKIRENNNWHLAQSLWRLLVKSAPLAESDRDTFFKGTYRWKYRSNSSFKFNRFDANFYRQLKSTAWIPDKQGKLHKPSECFAPTSENRELLGDSEFYLPDSFNISTGTATWLAKQLDIHVKIDDKDVLKRLRDLSGTDVSVKDVEPLYRFLYDNRPRRRVESVFSIRSYMTDAIPSWRQTFKEESLIFIPEPKPHWWLTDEVFWKNDRKVFGDDYGYLETHYGEHLKSFFRNSLEVPECAGTLDYIRGIKDIATTGQAKLSDRKRLEILYRSLWMSLQEDNNWEEDEEWVQMRDESCWFGKRENEWGFFSLQELVWRDDDLRSELFKNDIPFWAFDNDLLEFAKKLGVKGCYQDSVVKFSYCGYQEEDTDWSAEVCNLGQNIYNFLHSPNVCGERKKEKSAEILTRLSVRRVEKLEVKFELKEISVPDPNPRQSFLEETDQEAILWLASEADKNRYTWLIGDALQEYFGDVKELSSFVDDLLTKDRESVLTRWKQKGLQTNINILSPEEDSKKSEEEQTALVDDKLSNKSDSTDTDTMVGESDVGIPRNDENKDSVAGRVDESEVYPFSNEGSNSTADESEAGTLIDSETAEIDKSNDSSTADESKSLTNSVLDIRNISSPDTQSSPKTNSGTTQNVSGESESETPTVHEGSETENREEDTVENESDIATYRPRPGGSRTRPRRGKAINTPSGNQGTGHNSSRSGGREDDTHIDGTDTSPHDRKEIERIGMEHARGHEEEEGCTVEDVSVENLGYDLRSTTPDGEIRCIEVKARDKRALVVLTSNEWSVAEQLKDDYFLYVVLNAATQPELYIIQNPTDKVAVDERYDVRYQVPLSEITEHGIPV